MIYRDQNFPIPRVNLAGLLPSTDAYLTYEGSTTFPGCWESVTWVVMNKPIYVTRTELEDMRLLMQGDKMQGREREKGHERKYMVTIRFRLIQTSS